jgi:hypothetical protein
MTMPTALNNARAFMCANHAISTHTRTGRCFPSWKKIHSLRTDENIRARMPCIATVRRLFPAPRSRHRRRKAPAPDTRGTSTMPAVPKLRSSGFPAIRNARNAASDTSRRRRARRRIPAARRVDSSLRTGFARKNTRGAAAPDRVLLATFKTKFRRTLDDWSGAALCCTNKKPTVKDRITSRKSRVAKSIAAEQPADHFSKTIYLIARPPAQSNTPCNFFMVDLVVTPLNIGTL